MTIIIAFSCNLRGMVLLTSFSDHLPSISNKYRVTFIVKWSFVSHRNPWICKEILLKSTDFYTTIHPKICRFCQNLQISKMIWFLDVGLLKVEREMRTFSYFDRNLHISSQNQQILRILQFLHTKICPKICRFHLKSTDFMDFFTYMSF